MDNLYLFYGQESYLLEESVKKIKKYVATFRCYNGNIQNLWHIETSLDGISWDVVTPTMFYQSSVVKDFTMHLNTEARYVRFVFESAYCDINGIISAQIYGY